MVQARRSSRNSIPKGAEPCVSYRSYERVEDGCEQDGGDMPGMKHRRVVLDPPMVTAIYYARNLGVVNVEGCVRGTDTGVAKPEANEFHHSVAQLKLVGAIAEMVPGNSAAAE